MSKILATDVDGCVLDWHSGFIEYCNTLGWYLNNNHPQDSYDMHEWFLPNKGVSMDRDMFISLVKEFNGYPRALRALEDCDMTLSFAKEFGYSVVAITSFNNCPEQGKFRRDYLEAMFPDIFDDIIILGLGECKKETLQQVKPDIFIEDCRKHADNAVDLGIKTYIFDRSYNRGGKAQYVEGWEDIFSDIFAEGLLNKIFNEEE